MLDGGVFYCECAGMDDEPIEYVPKKDGQSKIWLIGRNLCVLWVGLCFLGIAIMSINGEIINEGVWTLIGVCLAALIPAMIVFAVITPFKR